MSDICSPESATASLTAVSAWAASGMSAARETLEKPTPLTAILHRFSHMAFLLPCLDRRCASFEASLREAPQDEEIFECHPQTFLILRCLAEQGLEGRTIFPRLFYLITRPTRGGIAAA